MDQLKTFARILRRLRSRRRESQEELAERAGISQTSVSRYELAEADPAMTALVALAEHFGVSVGHLCGKDDEGGDLAGRWLIDWDLVERFREGEMRAPGETWAVAIPENYRIVSSAEYAALAAELLGKSKRRRATP